MPDDTIDKKTAPCRLTVEPGDLFGLAFDLPADKRRDAIIKATIAEAKLTKEGQEE